MTGQSTRVWVRLLWACGLVTTVMAACKSPAELIFPPEGQGAGIAAGGNGSGGGDPTISNGSSMALTLTIEPASTTLDLTGTPATVQLTARLSDGTEPSGVAWSNAPDLTGYVDGAGLFHSDGFTAGTTTVTAVYGELSAQATITTRFSMVDNLGGLSQGQIDDLRAGGSADPNLRFLYPYDGTVFPRDLDGPELQLEGMAADALRVHISFPNFDYEGFFGPANPVRATLPDAIWRGLTYSATLTDQVQVEVTKVSGGQVSGPTTQSWRIAQGSLRGVFYYNTYDSGGAVKRIRPGEPAETFLSGCTVCHSVSSQGTVMTGGVNWGNGNPLDSETYDLAANGSVSTRDSDADGRKYAFAGLTPDGTLALTSGVLENVMPRGLSGNYPSRLIETATGNEVVAPTFPVQFAMTPMFAHDGTKVAFTDYDLGNPKTLRVMDVDLTQNPPLFSNLLSLVTATGNVAGWPSFLPDTGAVLYHDGDHFDTQRFCTGGSHADPSYASIRMVDVATQTVNDLGQLNGYDGNSFYLPYGELEEANVNYEPSLLPVAIGGYYWVIFTSRRAYGNHLGPGGTEGGANKWGSCPETDQSPSLRKKLWVAAIDTQWQGEVDPSHPAFYLPGQELNTGNMRGFAALEPCKDEDESCEYGFECCDGRLCLPTGAFDDDGQPIKTCQEGEGCSPIGSGCETAADCCDEGVLCINGVCSLPSPK